MNLTVNGEKKEYSEMISLSQLLDQIKIQNRDNIAVAVNNNVVPRSEFNKIELLEGDHIEIIHASAGG